MRMKTALSSFIGCIASLSLLSQSAMAKTLEERVKALEESLGEIEERVDENEVSATLNKVKFGLDFNTTMSNFIVNDAGKYNSQPNKWMMGLYLNMSAHINDYTKFTGRLSMTKAFGDIAWGLGSNALLGAGALDAGRAVGGGPQVFVERAYVDIFAGKHVAFTLGRLPGTDGPGANLRNSSARMSTYPAMAVNALGDGAVVTFMPFATKSGLSKSMEFRVGYSKIYQPFAADTNGGNIFTYAKGTAADADLVFATFETAFLPESAGTSLIMVTPVYLMNYAAPKGTSIGTQGSLAADANFGDLFYLNIHAEVGKVAGTGLNAFISASLYQGLNSKNVTLTQQSNNSTTMKLLNDKTAFALHAGARYDITESFKLGAEYFYGSQYWYALSRVSINDPLNFRNTRGHVIDAYAIYQIDIYQFVRLSYTLQMHNYINPGAPILSADKIDMQVHNIAMAYTLRF